MTSLSAKKLAHDMLVFDLESFNIKDFVYVLSSADNMYFNQDGQSFLSDNDYDTIKRYAQSLDPSNPYFTTIGSKVRGSAVKLPFPMGSLNQKYEGEIVKWIQKWNLTKQQFVITDKLDGTSALPLFATSGLMQIAYSKGDGFEGADITRHLCHFKSIPRNIGRDLVVRGEVILSRQNFETLRQLVKTRSGDTYKNARNMVAGLMNAEQNDPIVYQYLDFIAYNIRSDAHYSKLDQLQLLRDLGFKVPQYSVWIGEDINDQSLTEYLIDRRNISDYEIDGIVIDVDAYHLRQQINPSKDTLNPEYSVKYKVADAGNIATTPVIDVEWNVSKDGYWKPRVKVEPVELLGVTIQHATGFNAQFIKDNGVGPGAVIKITRSGDVIPFIVEVVSSSDNVTLPDGYWTETGVDLVVNDIETNETVKFEQLNDFFASIDAPHLREGNLKMIFDCGFTTPQDVILLTQSEICNIVGKVIGGKIYQGLRDKLTNIEPYVLMGSHSAFGRGVGKRKMKKLYEAFAGDMSKCQDVKAIVNVEGFDIKTATKIANGYLEYCQFFNQISHIVKLQQYQVKQGKFTNQKIVFTGFRDNTLEKKVTDQGGTISTSVSKQTTVVVAQNPDEHSGKLQKARQLGVPVISRQQFMEEM